MAGHNRERPREDWRYQYVKTMSGEAMAELQADEHETVALALRSTHTGRPARLDGTQPE